MANNASSPTPSATLVLPPRLPLAQPLLPPFSFPSEPIFPIPHPAPIYGHPFRLPLMVSASKPKANERETRFQGLQPPVPTTALLPSQTAFEHRFTTSSLRNGPQGCVKQEEGGQKLIPRMASLFQQSFRCWSKPEFFSHLSPGLDIVPPPPIVQNLKVPPSRTGSLPTASSAGDTFDSVLASHHPLCLAPHNIGYYLRAHQYQIKTFLCFPEMTTLCCWGQRTSDKSKQLKKREGPHAFQGITSCPAQGRQTCRGSRPVLHRPAEGRLHRDGRVPGCLQIVSSCEYCDTDKAWKQDFLQTRRFTDEQQHQLRDIRRRGKNKVDFQKMSLQMVFDPTWHDNIPLLDGLRWPLRTAERENSTSLTTSRWENILSLFNLKNCRDVPAFLGIKFDLKVNQQISSCQYCINLIKYKITVGFTRSMLMDGRKSSTEKPKSMKNWRWYLIFLLVLMNFNMIVLINHLPFSLYLICWHWFQMELQELLQEVDKVMRDYSKVHMFGFFNFDHFQLLFCPSISIQMLYCCFLCQFRSLLIGSFQDQPYVGIPTRFEPFRDQLINMKVRMLTQCIAMYTYYEYENDCI